MTPHEGGQQRQRAAYASCQDAARHLVQPRMPTWPGRRVNDRRGNKPIVLGKLHIRCVSFTEYMYQSSSLRIVEYISSKRTLSPYPAVDPTARLDVLTQDGAKFSPPFFVSSFLILLLSCALQRTDGFVYTLWLAQMQPCYLVCMSGSVVLQPRCSTVRLHNVNTAAHCRFSYYFAALF